LLRTPFVLAVALALLPISPATAQTAGETPGAPAAPTPPPSTWADFDYVASHNGLMFQLKQIYRGKENRPTLFFGENLAWLHSPCGSAAFCTNGGGTDTDIEIGPALSRGNVFAAVTYGSFRGNGLALQGLGFGLQKLPEGKFPLDWSANVFYWNNAGGTYVCPVTNIACFGPAVYPNNAIYRIYRWQAAGQYALRQGRPWYVNFGITGDTGTRVQAPPIDFWHAGAFVGLGFKM